MLKVIYIMTFCPNYESESVLDADYFWINSKGEHVDIWRADWGHVFAQDVKRFFPEVAFEVWRPDYRAETELVHVFDDGVVHRTFPSRKVKFREGLKTALYASSDELIEKLATIVREHEGSKDLVCHLPLDFSYLGHTILKKFNGKIPFLHTSHLNPNLLNADLKTSNPLKLIHRKFIKRTYDKHKLLLGDIVVTLDRIDFFKKYTHSNVYQLNSLFFDFAWANTKISKGEARKKLNLDPDIFIIFSSSRLVPEKQIDILIRCLAELKSLQFLCIISGSGEVAYQDELKELVNMSGLSNQVSFVGYLTDELVDYYCASDAFISTSKSEGGPVSGIKAMALDVPIISTNTGIVYSLLKENNAGVILSKKDTSLWVQQIARVIEGEKIGKVDIQKLKKDYELKSSIEQLVKYYQKAIDNFQAKRTNAKL